MKYLKFKKISSEEYNVKNNKGDYLGCVIREKKQWRFYFDEPIKDSAVWFTHECLAQLVEFMKILEYGKM